MKMKYQLNGCSYELIKDLLMSQDSLIEHVQQIDNGAIVTLKKDANIQDLYHFLGQGPLYTFCAHTHILKI